MSRRNVRTAFAVATLAVAPMLMGALKPPEFPTGAALSTTQQRIVEFVQENGYGFVEFVGAYRFFSSDYGCRQDETVYLLIVSSPREGIGGAGVCVQDGEEGAIRPAPMRRMGTEAEDAYLDNDTP